MARGWNRHYINVVDGSEATDYGPFESRKVAMEFLGSRGWRKMHLMGQEWNPPDHRARGDRRTAIVYQRKHPPIQTPEKFPCPMLAR